MVHDIENNNMAHTKKKTATMICMFIKIRKKQMMKTYHINKIKLL